MSGKRRAWIEKVSHNRTDLIAQLYSKCYGEMIMKIKLYSLMLSVFVLALFTTLAIAQVHRPEVKKQEKAPMQHEQMMKEQKSGMGINSMISMNYMAAMSLNLDGMATTMKMMIRNMERMINIKEVMTDKEFTIIKFDNLYHLRLSGSRDYPDPNNGIFYAGVQLTFVP